MTIAKPGPISVPLTEPFWTGARRGELLLQRCRACSHHQHYPRALCVRCWHRELEWVPSCGEGRVWTFTVVHRPDHPAWDDDIPYVLAIVELDEGVRLLTNIVGVEPAEVAVDQRVTVRFMERDGTTLVQFGPDRS